MIKRSYTSVAYSAVFRTPWFNQTTRVTQSIQRTTGFIFPIVVKSYLKKYKYYICDRLK